MLADSRSHSVHLDAIVAAGPSFCVQLQEFDSGDSETGKGFLLSDAAVARFTLACPKLIHVSFAGSRFLTDDSLLAIVENCPGTRYLSITGNDKCDGQISGASLDTLRKSSELGKGLVKLRLTDQKVCDTRLDKAYKALSMARKKLAIEVGNTHERGGHVTTWLGGKEREGYQAFGGTGDFSQYGGF